MADETEGRQPSRLKTLLWTAAAVTLAVGGTGLLGGIPLIGGFLAEHAALMGIAKWGLTLFSASKAWGSHKENQAIEQENAARQSQAEAMYRQRQIQAERAAAVEQMQDGGESRSWRNRVDAQRAAYSEATR